MTSSPPDRTDTPETDTQDTDTREPEDTDAQLPFEFPISNLYCKTWNPEDEVDLHVSIGWGHPVWDVDVRLRCPSCLVTDELHPLAPWMWLGDGTVAGYAAWLDLVVDPADVHLGFTTTVNCPELYPSQVNMTAYAKVLGEEVRCVSLGMDNVRLAAEEGCLNAEEWGQWPGYR